MTILIADPDVVAVPVVDEGEALVDLAGLGLACTAGRDRRSRQVRSGVAARLVAAQAALPDGLRLLVVEGARSAQAQAETVAAYTRQLRIDFPGEAEEEIQRLSTRYVAPVAYAPHVAGAAVDLTLADAVGRPLWMGTEVDATPEQSDGACAFASEGIDAEARARRDVMAAALSGAGLVNYPTEWWHWSYGDRYWALTTGAPYALYGPVERTS
ncbi:dipeptidase [Streptomyces sp. NBC_01267]|uniref:M15 family metallopeptidase n=1 Tax=unclassified Streptomyces TaxID=2593676 RepID=UPI002023EC55|nr:MULTISPECIES: M15 family metallopeptidase [unclassified Streptomyces]WSC21291.1 dipeptidase [Streptomyces sp. NBC_01766]WSV55228.1 dipeptidase [Streptomyces sp. NBC_01014]